MTTRSGRDVDVVPQTAASPALLLTRARRDANPADHRHQCRAKSYPPRAPRRCPSTQPQAHSRNIRKASTRASKHTANDLVRGLYTPPPLIVQPPSVSPEVRCGRARIVKHWHWAVFEPVLMVDRCWCCPYP